MCAVKDENIESGAISPLEMIRKNNKSSNKRPGHLSTQWDQKRKRVSWIIDLKRE